MKNGTIRYLNYKRYIYQNGAFLIDSDKEIILSKEDFLDYRNILETIMKSTLTDKERRKDEKLDRDIEKIRQKHGGNFKGGIVCKYFQSLNNVN